MNKILIGLFLALSAWPASAEILSVGSSGRIDTGHSNPKDFWHACRSYDDYSKFERIKKDDYEAALKLSEQRCIKLYEGTRVTVDDRAYLGFKGLCVRPSGEFECYWIDQLWISRIK